MLSILIPTYNYDCTPLVQELQQQIVTHNLVAEVIVMDDASTLTDIRTKLASINTLPHCRLVQLSTNVGIARIRNLLADEAQYPYLLFLDSDVFPTQHDFLQRYIDARHNADVICGGLLFRDTPPSPQCSLRYLYGSRVESQPVEQRLLQPYGEFRTLNFFISQQAFNNTRFNEDFVRYGHEDTLFGKQLQLNGHTITHIHNPIFHDVPDTNEQFLAKTRRSILNLHQHRHMLTSHVRLLQFYDKLQRTHTATLVATLFRLIEKALLHNLLSSRPSLFIFNLYKVGYLCNIMTEK